VAVGLPVADTPLGTDLLAATGATAWRGAPYLGGSSAVGGVRTDAQVVLRTRGGQPLLAVRPAALGRCLGFASDGTYRWVLSPEADEESRRLHRTFWSVVATWLAMPRDESQVVMLLDPPVAAFGQPARAIVQVSRAFQPVARARVTVTVQGPRAHLSLPCQPTSTPGRYQTALSHLQPGRYEVTAAATADQALRTAQRALGSAQRTLVVEPGGAEVAQLTRQEGRLREMALRGGGEYVGLPELGGLLDRLPTAALSQPTTVAVRPFRSLWAFLAILTLCAADWFLRRRHGL
jgi:hypothetical protein